MPPLRFTSCLGANTDFVGAATAHYVSQQLGIASEFVSDSHWRRRERLFDEGKIAVNWMCGLLYVFKVANQAPLEVLAAPVMAEERYQKQPIYFSDVVVHRDSPFHAFADLVGVTWAYNEPSSHSGCYLVRSHLYHLGKDMSFFGKRVESGSHHASLWQVLTQKVDVTALDSTVLAWELKQTPDIQHQIRIVETLGPSPSPPWVISKKVPANLRHALRQTLIAMPETAEGRDILATGLLEKFVPLGDSDYDLIRQMRQTAERVFWE